VKKTTGAHVQINYRHFEDDMNPRVFKPEGLKHLDRVIDLVRLSTSRVDPLKSSVRSMASTP